MRWLFLRRIDCGLKRNVRQRFELFLQNPQLSSQLINLPLLADGYSIKLLKGVFLKSQLSLYAIQSIVGVLHQQISRSRGGPERLHYWLFNQNPLH